MAATIVSGNLNTFGNNGNFETDPSTWGFGTGAVRSNEQHTKGLYSLKFTITDFWGFLFGGTRPAQASFSPVHGKKYVISAKVKTPAVLPAANEESVFSILIAGQTGLGFVNKTVAEASDWVTIKQYWQHDSGAIDIGFGFCVQLFGDTFGGDQAIIGGVLYVDEFEIYEYTGTYDGEEPEPEPEPEPEETDLVFHSKNPITLSKNAVDGWQLLPNYRLYNDIRVEDVADSNDYVSKLKVELPPDTSGQVIFYLNEAFRDAFSFTPPTLNQNTIVRLTDRIKRFKSFTGELTGLLSTPSELIESDASLVLYGGINKFKWPTLDYFSSYVSSNKKFLTWAPIEKYVDRLQEDYLNFWIYDAAIATLKLQIKAYFDDDTNETSVTTSLAPVTYKSLYQIPAGPVNSGATIVNPAKNLVKYELTLLNQDDEVISEVRTYYVSAVRHPLTRFFMFLDSLGTYQVLRFTGQASEETSYNRETLQKFLPHNYSVYEGDFANNNNVMDQKNLYSSGYIKNRLAEQWHEYMKDFLLASRVYDVTNGQRLPIIITGGTHVKEDQNYERFIRFEAKPAYIDQSFTPASV